MWRSFQGKVQCKYQRRTIKNFKSFEYYFQGKYKLSKDQKFRKEFDHSICNDLIFDDDHLTYHYKISQSRILSF